MRPGAMSKVVAEMGKHGLVGYITLFVWLTSLRGEVNAQLESGRFVPHGQATRVLLVPGEWGHKAVANLSRWRSNLFKATERHIAEHNDRDDIIENHVEYSLYEPFISCPPGRPLKRFGPDGDGGKWLCHVAFVQEPCLIISAGSNMNFGFEESMLEESKCSVLTLDCTCEGKILGPRHDFKKLCVGSREDAIKESQKYTNYGLLLSIAKYGSVPVLKIDVESAEFPFFAEWHEHSASLPEQISVELHTNKLAPTSMQRRSNFGSLDLTIFFFHMSNLGYGIVAKEANPGSPCCYEYTLFRVEGPAHRQNVR